MAIPRSKKKSKNPQKKAIRKASHEAINYFSTLCESVLRSEFHFDNKQVDSFIESINRYSRFIADPKIGMNYKEFIDYNKRKREEENEDRK